MTDYLSQTIWEILAIRRENQVHVPENLGNISKTQVCVPENLGNINHEGENQVHFPANLGNISH